MLEAVIDTRTGADHNNTWEAPSIQKGQLFSRITPFYDLSVGDDTTGAMNMRAGALARVYTVTTMAYAHVRSRLTSIILD